MDKVSYESEGHKQNNSILLKDLEMDISFEDQKLLDMQPYSDNLHASKMSANPVNRIPTD